MKIRPVDIACLSGFVGGAGIHAILERRWFIATLPLGLGFLLFLIASEHEREALSEKGPADA